MSTRTNCPVILRALVASTGLILAAGAAPGAVILQAGGWQVEVADELVSDVDLFVDFASLEDNVLVIEKFAQFRENYYGRGYTHELMAQARLFGRTRLQFSGFYIREFLLDGQPFQIRRLFISRTACITSSVCRSSHIAEPFPAS